MIMNLCEWYINDRLVISSAFVQHQKEHPGDEILNKVSEYIQRYFSDKGIVPVVLASDTSPFMVELEPCGWLVCYIQRI